MWFKKEQKSPFVGYLTLFVVILLVVGLAYHVLKMALAGASVLDEVLLYAVPVALGFVASEAWRKQQ